VTTQTSTVLDAQHRVVTEESTDALRPAGKPRTHAATLDGNIPTAYPELVQRYVTYVQQAAQVNVELAAMWTQLVTTFSGAPALRAANVGAASVDTVRSVSDVAQETAETAIEAVGTSGPESARKQADGADESELQQALEADRAEAKHALEVARESYRSLTKAELSALLAERGLPRTGTVAVLIDRLVAADSAS